MGSYEPIDGKLWCFSLFCCLIMGVCCCCGCCGEEYLGVMKAKLELMVRWWRNRIDGEVVEEEKEWGEVVEEEKECGEVVEEEKEWGEVVEEEN